MDVVHARLCRTNARHFAFRDYFNISVGGLTYNRTELEVSKPRLYIGFCRYFNFRLKLLQFLKKKKLRCFYLRQ